MTFNLKQLSTDRTLINNIRDNCVPLSDPVNSTGTTYSVVELVDLENLLAKKNLTLSDRLQEVRYNSEEGFKKVWVVFSAIGLPQREFWRWVSAHACMASRFIMP